LKSDIFSQDALLYVLEDIGENKPERIIARRQRKEKRQPV